MIIDSLDNIDLYENFNPDIYSGLKYLKTMDSDIALGTYSINDKVDVIVSEYDTIANFERGYEAHKHVIDIQLPIKGLERVKWSPIQGMDVNIPYDSKKDRTFYKNPQKQGNHVDIGNGVFAIMFPNDGHGPQHFVSQSERIKKVTVKVKV